MAQAAWAELPITGYLDRFSHRPGECFAVHVNVPSGESYKARLVRVLGGDPNPTGPGLGFEDHSAAFAGEFLGRHQRTLLGSHAVIPKAPARATGPCTWTALFWMAAPPPAEATVISEEEEGAFATLAVGPNGAVARLRGQELATSTPLVPYLWYRLWLSADPETGRVLLGQVALDGSRLATATESLTGLVLPKGAGGVLLAARNREAPTDHLTAKLEAPAILAGFHEAWPEPAKDGETPLAAWDFSIGMETQAITDIGPQGCHGSLFNIPGRAMVGARWSGSEMCWRHAPADYGAIHFHADDLSDCRWAVDFEFAVPEGLASGSYALHLSCAGGEDYVPLYILPPKGHQDRPPVAFLASTFTYQAYANHARFNNDEAMRARVREWGAAPHNPDDHPVYGRSTYNKHPDGSGVAFSTRLRPILTMRPGFLTFVDARGSGLRHYPADSHLLGWLEARGIPFDIITDEDLHDEGVDILKPYKVVLTGSHPEYHTLETLDGLQTYTDTGGRLVYLGGNGFYWRIALTSSLPGVLELRRSEGGIRAWAAEPGEYFHQFDGQYGGLWRRNRRPPQMLAGVGFSGQGLFEGTHYRRLPSSYDPAFAWVFDGITEDVLGDYGLSGGGAAGFELDRADPALGTPAGTTILARSEDPPASFVTVPEELLSHIKTVTGESTEALKRAEIVHFETPGGGAVFAVGSITFCGSLWKDGAFGGPVSRMLENVVRRFAS